MTTSLQRCAALGAVIVAVALLIPSARPAAQQPASRNTSVVSPDRLQRFAAALRTKGAYVPGELLVKFRDGTQPAEQARALSVLRRAATTSDTRWIGDVLLVDTPGEPDAAAAAARLATQPEVAWAQPNYLRHRLLTPNDPVFPDQWNLKALDMPRVWDINPGGSSSVKVAVVDTGVTTTTATFTFRLWTGNAFEDVPVSYRANPDIAASRMLPGRDFVFWPTLGTTGPVLDMDGHGSHVAGTILQETNNNAGVAGMAYAATLLPLKACLSYWDIQILLGAIGEEGFIDPSDAGFCDDASVAQAFRYAADQGAQIINYSAGAPGQAPILLDALGYAVSHGAFVSIAAGNEQLDGNPVEYPAAYAPQINGVVAVSAVGPSLRRAYYSNSGSYVELAAPGGNDREGGANAMIWQTTLLPTDSDPETVVRPRFDRYAVVAFEGTSMAAPHVAGAAALLYSQGITTPAAIEAALRQFATDLGPAGRDNDFGYGLIAPRPSLRGMGLAK
jgi:serine protease